jgi:hypothetical protein
MSNLPPVNPYDQPPPLDYFPPAEDNAEKLVRLAVIFNYISVGIDLVGVLLFAGFGSVVFIAPQILGPQNPGDPPPQVIGGVYIGLAVVMMVYGIVKAIGTRKLQKAAPGAWGWGLAVGIIGCCQALCGSCCCLQAAPGIYTVVILCFQNVRHYLALRQERNATGGMGGPPDAMGGPPATPPFGG